MVPVIDAPCERFIPFEGRVLGCISSSGGRDWREDSTQAASLRPSGQVAGAAGSEALTGNSHPKSAERQSGSLRLPLSLLNCQRLFILPAFQGAGPCRLSSGWRVGIASACEQVCSKPASSPLATSESDQSPHHDLCPSPTPFLPLLPQGLCTRRSCHLEPTFIQILTGVTSPSFSFRLQDISSEACSDPWLQ